MTDYQKMYSTLFNAITDALEQMDAQNYGEAKETLISAQQKAEEIYINSAEYTGYRGGRPAAKQKRTASAAALLYSGIRLLLIRQLCQIIHARFQCQRNTAALLKAHVALARLDLGIIALVDTCQHLHLDLRITFLFAQLSHAGHLNHLGKIMAN